MYRVVVVDDEPIIRKNLRDSIEWDVLGLELAGEASNGAEALMLIESVRPVILITDIKMPVMDGMELIKEIHRRGLRIRIIIISGYSDYEYLKEAIKFSVDSYLLKPIDENELVSILSSLVDAVEKDISTDIQQREGAQLLKRNTLLRLVSGTIEYREFREKAKMLDLSFYGDMHVVAATTIDKFKNAVILNKDDQELLFHILVVYQEIANCMGAAIIFPDSKGFPVSIFSGLSDESTRKLAECVLEKITIDIERHHGLKLSTAIGPAVSSVGDLHISYKEALNLLDVDASLFANSVDIADNRALINNQVVGDMLKYIKMHCLEDISLKQTASQFFMNAAYMGQLFRKNTGESFTEYVNRCRIEKARELLMLSKKKVYEVMEEVGFTDLHYFIKIFRKYTGINPSEVKRNHQK